MVMHDLDGKIRCGKLTIYVEGMPISGWLAFWKWWSSTSMWMLAPDYVASWANMLGLAQLFFFGDDNNPSEWETVFNQLSYFIWWARVSLMPQFRRSNVNRGLNPYGIPWTYSVRSDFNIWRHPKSHWIPSYVDRYIIYSWTSKIIPVNGFMPINGV